MSRCEKQPPRMNKRELYRSADQGKIAGVCAGLAEYFGWEAWLVRILVVSGVLFGLPFLILGYIAAWFILEKAPSQTVKAQQERSQSDYANQYKKNTGRVNRPNNQKNHDYADESIKVKARVWQAGEPPKQALYDIRRKFRSLEKKVQVMEQYVTSAEFAIAREINKL